MQNHKDRIEKEDITLFINACFSGTGQQEFYSSSDEQILSLDFLHRYILINYRSLYTQILAFGINHYNQVKIITNLLATGKACPPEARKNEGQLISQALENLPPQRVYKLFHELRQKKINNRRTRAVVKEYLTRRNNQTFDAIKYRHKFRSIARHCHLKLEKELGDVLFRKSWKHITYQTPLFEHFRQAHYSQKSLYYLPYTVAEGLAASQGISREVFLKKIAPNMTENEKFRLQSNTADMKGVRLEVNLNKMPLTQLLLYIFSLEAEQRETRREEFEKTIQQVAEKTLQKHSFKLGKVAAILDRSYSATASREKFLHPLAISLGCHYLLQQAAQLYQSFWTTPFTHHPFGLSAKGQTNLAQPFLDALKWEPDLVIIVSDGYENDPPGAMQQLYELYRQKIPGKQPIILHFNPVFDHDSFSPKALSPSLPAMGLRSSEELPLMFQFALFSNNQYSFKELNHYLAETVRGFLG